MKSEKRNHLRVRPRGLQAGIVFNPTTAKELAFEADILDISYSGIRVRLRKPLADDIVGKIKITMILPESGTPFSVHGVIKHQHSESECGLHYIDHVEGSIDDLMFECVELDESTVLIKTN